MISKLDLHISPMSASSTHTTTTTTSPADYWKAGAHIISFSTSFKYYDIVVRTTSIALRLVSILTGSSFFVRGMLISSFALMVGQLLSFFTFLMINTSH